MIVAAGAAGAEARATTNPIVPTLLLIMEVATALLPCWKEQRG
jgi:hypothetical protein